GITPVAPPCHPLQLNFHVHAGRQVQLHQRIHRLRRRFHDIQQPLVSPDLELLTGLLVDMRGALNRKLLDPRRQRDGPRHFGPTPLDSFDDLGDRLVQHPVVEPLEPNPDALINLHSLTPELIANSQQRIANSSEPRRLISFGLLAIRYQLLAFGYATISVTTPEPTVLPPSRIANRSP